MKNILIFSILFNLLLSIFLVYFILTKDVQNIQYVTQDITIDTNLVKRELKRLSFENVADKRNTKPVYVSEKQIERYYNEKQAINNYYYDSTTIINENQNVIAIKATKDTIKNDDGEFRIIALSNSDIFGLNLDYELNQLEITKTITQVPKNQFFVGANIGGNRTMFVVELNLQYLRNGKHQFNYQQDLINNTYTIGYSRKTDFKRPKLNLKWLK